MMRIATYSDLKSALSKTALSESVILQRAQSSQNKSTFLSHSSKDKPILPGIITLLENHGSSVYVDDGDQRLPKTPSKVTAAILRDTICKLPKFVVLVTPNSKDSRWVPWELGLGDAYKTPRHVAVFPAAAETSQDEWVKQEYLGLYGRVVYGDLQGQPNPCWFVYDPLENTGTQLRTWLTQP